MAIFENVLEEYQKKLKDIFTLREEDGKLCKEKLQILMAEKAIMDEKLLEYERKCNEFEEMISERNKMIEALKSCQCALSSGLHESESRMCKMVSENFKWKDDLAERKRKYDNLTSEVKMLKDDRLKQSMVSVFILILKF